MRTTVENIIQGLIWSEYLKKFSPFYARLKNFIDNIPGYGDYFIQRNEMFARTFEVYINYELEQKGITNYFLSKPKYRKDVYPKPSEIKPLIPLFRKFISLLRDKIS